ncbi:hypothetical protein [Tranquillimonas rosea]|uniref:hypothetical protein n=1 Tax=Tranquillimonas rosea TaxID=641238 RepID=UPI003BAB1657
MTAISHRDNGLTRTAAEPVGDPEQAACYRRLWCAVLHENLSMQFGQQSGVRGGLTPTHWRNWHKSEDFAIVCSLAGVDVYYMRNFVDRELRSANPGAVFFRRNQFGRNNGTIRGKSRAAT